MKLPFIQLYPGDWLKDSISGCSLAAQGLWLRIMFILHESEQRGYLVQAGKPIPPESVARRCGLTLEQYLALLSELDTAGVPGKQRKVDGNNGSAQSGDPLLSLDITAPTTVIYSRRMVKDEQIRGIRSRAGKKGGRATLLKQKLRQNSSKVEANGVANIHQNPGTGTGTDPPSSFSEEGVQGEGGCFAAIDSLHAILFRLFSRPPGQRLSYKAEHELAEICRRPDVLAEVAELELLKRKEDSYFPQSLEALLEQWDKTVDRARNFIAPSKTNQSNYESRRGKAPVDHSKYKSF